MVLWGEYRRIEGGGTAHGNCLRLLSTALDVELNRQAWTTFLLPSPSQHRAIVILPSFDRDSTTAISRTNIFTRSSSFFVMCRNMDRLAFQILFFLRVVQIVGIAIVVHNTGHLIFFHVILRQDIPQGLIVVSLTVSLRYSTRLASTWENVSIVWLDIERNPIFSLNVLLLRCHHLYSWSFKLILVAECNRRPWKLH